MLKKMIIICGCFALNLLAVPIPTFSQTVGQDGYIGVITNLDNKEIIGAHISFANIRTSHPFITFPSGSYGKTDKVYEDDEIVVLLLVAKLTGSTETFYINKKSKRFTRVEVGVLEAVVTGKDFQPIVSYGTLK